MKPSRRDGFIFAKNVLNKMWTVVNNNFMDMTMANLEDKETFFKKPEDIDVKPIEEKVFQDGVKEILGKEYD